MAAPVACDNGSVVLELEQVPLLRGVFHLWAFLAAVAAGIVLVVLADGVVATASSWVYATALAAMFGASALYHRVSWKSTAKRLWARRLDHSTIFLFIAGTYTPFALLGLQGVMRWLVLAMAWAGAAVGLALELAWIDSPRWLSAVAYLLVGWVGVLTVPQLFSGMGVAVAVLEADRAAVSAGKVVVKRAVGREERTRQPRARLRRFDEHCAAGAVGNEVGPAVLQRQVLESQRAAVLDEEEAEPRPADC